MYRIDLKVLTGASMQQRLVKTGGRLVKHARYYWLMLAAGHLTRGRFAAMLRRIAMLPLPAGEQQVAEHANRVAENQGGASSVGEIDEERSRWAVIPEMYRHHSVFCWEVQSCLGQFGREEYSSTRARLKKEIPAQEPPTLDSRSRNQISGHR